MNSLSYFSTTPAGATSRRLPHSLISTEEGQAFLHDARCKGLDVRCACKPSATSPLIIRGRSAGPLHLARQDYTCNEHSLRCRHANPTRFAAAQGLPKGSLTIDDDGRIEIDLGLMFTAAPRSSGSGGTYQHVPPNRGRRLRNLASFLLDHAGLTPQDLESHDRDPWRVLLAATRTIRVAGAQENLEGRLLMPFSVYNFQSKKKVNVAKVLTIARNAPKSARTVLGQVLVAMLLPADGRARSVGTAFDVSSLFGLRRLHIPPFALTRAWSESSAAEAHHRAGQPVLAFGMATARGSLAHVDLAVEQLALIPVDSRWASAPTLSASTYPETLV